MSKALSQSLPKDTAMLTGNNKMYHGRKIKYKYKIYKIKFK